jgi:hypothetical protein
MPPVIWGFILFVLGIFYDPMFPLEICYPDLSRADAAAIGKSIDLLAGVEREVRELNAESD